MTLSPGGSRSTRPYLIHNEPVPATVFQMPIVNVTRQTTLAFNVEIADNPFKRMQGLLGRASLPQGNALVIPHCNSIHMLFMNFAIDVVFLDRGNKVVGLAKGIKPFEISGIFWKSSCALELPVGTIEASRTQWGDEVLIT